MYFAVLDVLPGDPFMSGKGKVKTLNFFFSLSIVAHPVLGRSKEPSDFYSINTSLFLRRISLLP